MPRLKQSQSPEAHRQYHRARIERWRKEWEEHDRELLIAAKTGYLKPAPWNRALGLTPAQEEEFAKHAAKSDH